MRDIEPDTSIKRFLSLRQLFGHPVTHPVTVTRDEFNEILNERTQGRAETLG